MSDETNHNENKSYSAEDLRRYLAGEMPAAEMHALEQASLEDPMLDDALEGMRNFRSDTREDLAILERRLGYRSAEKKRVVPFWTSAAKVAAGVILLIGLSGLGYFLTTKSAPPHTIALSDQNAPSAAGTPAPAPPAASTPAFADTVDSTPAGKASKKTGTYPPGDNGESSASNARVGLANAKTAKKRESHVPTEASGLPDAEITKTDQLSPATVPEAQKETPTDSVPDAVAASRAVSGMSKDKAAAESLPEMLQGKAAGTEAAPASNRQFTSPAFSGQVLDDKGQAVAGVSVQMGKSATITDIQGKFSLPPVDGESNHLDFNSVGYQSLTLIPDLQHRANITVTLSPASTALNDVVVEGYGTRKKSAGPATQTTPAPAPGWRKYRNYLGANKVQPAIDSSLHGTETVTFSITRDGEPVDFVVDQSLSSEHDSVTVRIIRNGPKWKPAKDSTRRMSLALPF